MNIDELLAQRAVEQEDDRLKILTTGRRMRDISADSVRLLEQENETRNRFFQFGDVLAEVVEDEKRGVQMRVFSQVVFKGVLDRLANYVKINEKGQLNPARPPPDVVADILALTNLPLPMLEAVVKTPVFSAGGDREYFRQALRVSADDNDAALDLARIHFAREDRAREEREEAVQANPSAAAARTQALEECCMTRQGTRRWRRVCSRMQAFCYELP